MSDDEREALLALPGVRELLREEREACAEIADTHARYEAGNPAPDGYCGSALAAVAEAIRARGQK
jgi:hypothetical protein